MSDGTPIIIKKKKASGHAAHHGGAWKVAYADFVTAMMAFFMVMWIMGLSDQTRAQIAGYFNDPLGYEKTLQHSKEVINIKSAPPQANHQNAPIRKESPAEDEKRIEEMKDKLKEAVKNDAEFDAIAKQIEITVTPEGLQIEFVENTGAVFFESGSAVIRPIARDVISKMAPILAKSDRKMIIEGHTDSTKYPSATYTNWDLSGDRANALRRLLVTDGVTEKQVLQIRGYADTKLKRPDDPTHFSNRRVTVLLPFKSVTDPMLDLPKEDFQQAKEGVFHKPTNIVPSKAEFTQANKNH